jgi:hypothetical protein
MSPTSCHCSTPRRSHGCVRRIGKDSGVGSARSGLASLRVAPQVLSGAAAGHDRVRDGTGWDHRAPDHGHPRPPIPYQDCRLHPIGSVSLFSRTHIAHFLARFRNSFCVSLPTGNGAAGNAREKRSPLPMSTGRLRSVARRPPPASRPGRLPGGSRACAQGRLVLGRDSRLDAVSGSPART